MSFREKIDSRFGKGVFLFAARSFNSLAGLVFALFAGRFLTVEDHGVFAAVLARMVIAQAILEVGLQYSLVRYLAPAIRAGEAGEVQSIVRASLWLKGVTFAILGGLVMVLAILLSLVTMPGPVLELLPEYGSPILLWMIFLGGAAMSFVSYQEAVLVAHGSYLRLALWIPLTGILRLTFLSLAYAAGTAQSPEHIVFAYSLGPVLSVVCFFFVFPASFFTRLAGATDWRAHLRKLISYNSFIVLASFFSIFSDWMEVLMLSEARDTGIYNAARMPLQGFLILLSTMQSMFLPWFSGLVNLEEYRTVFSRIYKWLVPGCVALIPGLFVLAWFVPLWFGQEYEGSVRILYLLYPGYLLKLLFAPLGTALFALDRPRLVAVEAGARMIAGFILNSILISRYGIMGAAISGFVAPFAGWIFLIFCYARFFKTGEFPFPERSNAK